MDKIEGKDLMVFLGGPDGSLRAVAVSTSCTLSVDRELTEVAWPGDGRWRRYRTGRRGWEVTVDGLVAADGVDDPLGLMEGSDGGVLLSFSTVAPHPGGEPALGFTPDGRLSRYGYALVSALTEAGEDGQLMTRSLTFQGTGPLMTGEVDGDFAAADFAAADFDT